MSGHTYPLDPWRIRETAYDPKMVGRNETIFALANGNLGMRGNFEEGTANVTDGTYLNGFYEEAPIVYGELAYAYARNRQVMLNLADAKVIRLLVDGEPFDLSTGRIHSYLRELDLREGVLTRTVEWESPQGAVVELAIRRLVSLSRPEVAAISYAVIARSRSTEIELISQINGRVENQAGADDPRIGTHLDGPAFETLECRAAGLDGLLVQRTHRTALTLACAMTHSLSGAATFETEREDSRPSLRVAATLDPDTPFELTKYIAYCRSRVGEAGSVSAAAEEAAAAARESGFEALAGEQRDCLERFWSSADIEIGGDEAVQQGLRYNLFSLFQSAGRDGRTSIAAKGLSGEGYEGHYFWDTEIYALPFFTYCVPDVAASLLRYRCSILEKARLRAAEMSQRGALFPWRTIGGEETSPYYPAGSAQYHINADIVFALTKYLLATGDRTLLHEGGAELIFETARLWADLGDWLPPRGDPRPEPPGSAGQPGAAATDDDRLFYLNEVTGPDEYTALVNNNTFTNLMAQFNLATAVRTAEALQADAPAEYARIAERIGLDRSEIEEWGRAAERIFLPYDRARGITAQDDAFLQRARWDFEHTPPEHHPLLLHYHPLVIYRYQVLKQPDVVLAQFLRGDRFSLAEKKRNFDYYDPLTTGDSSLSPCIQSVAAVELGYTELAYRYFMRTARMDLDDINGNVVDGFHTAAMAGTWISLVYGFAGMRDYDGHLSFDPRLPREWSHLKLRLTVHGGALGVDITHERVVYRLEGSGGLTFTHRGRELRLAPGERREVALRPLLECVIFDLDGVITDTAEYHFRAWSRLAEEVGAPIDRSFNERLKGVSRMESLELILQHGGKSLPAAEKEELAARKNGYYRDLITQITPDDLLDGVLELINGLRAEGVKIAIASVSHNVFEVVKRLEIGALIDLIVDPRRVVKGKPDPEIFLTAAETLGLPVEHCVGVEDAQAGIDAIKAAHMCAVGIGSTLQGADWVVSQTSGLTLEGLKNHFNAFVDGRRE